MADHGLHFAMSVHQMSDDLQEMASNVERGRKHWKHTGLSSEQRLQDAEAATVKAKSKYDVLAEQYDRARTGDRQSGRFGLKTKSAAQQEEDLHRKVQAADADYLTKVQGAQASRQELVTSLRPQAVRALTDLIVECDSGVTLQLQKLALLNEKLLLGNGLCVSPLKNQPNGMAMESRSLREVAHSIDNEKDFRDYVLSFSNKAGSRTSEIKYEKHPTLASLRQGQPPQPHSLTLSAPMNAPMRAYQDSDAVASTPPGGFERSHRPSQSGQISGITPYQASNRDGLPPHMQQSHYPTGPFQPSHSQPPQYLGAQIPDIPPHSPITMPGTNLDRSDASPLNRPPSFGGLDAMKSGSGSGPGPIMNNSHQYGDSFQPEPPQRPTEHFRSSSQPQPPDEAYGPKANQTYVTPANIGHPRRNDGGRTDLPPLKPVFGVTLEELFRRDDTAVPSIVHQCTIAVELFGLDVEGIYRTSGSNPHIMELKAIFDNGKLSGHPTLFHAQTQTKLMAPQTPPKSTSATPSSSTMTSPL